MGFPDDRHYDDPGCDYMRAEVTLRTAYDIVHDESLTGRVVEVDHGAQEIRTRTGMPAIRYQTWLMRASLYLIGRARGEVWAPEFQTAPRRLSVVRGLAVAGGRCAQ